MTTVQLADALKEKYATFLVNPEVTIVLTRARVRVAFVLGEVAKPGAYPVTEKMKITELLAAAGDLVGEKKELAGGVEAWNDDDSCGSARRQ